MSGCPFGFHSAAPDLPSASKAADTQKGEGLSPRKAKEPGSKCPFSGAGASDADGDRFDYNKDPISWFYQNQIKSEEQFQAKKTELRKAAVERLESVFEKKGKHLIIDSDDDFSIATSELSAWDSDVHSIRTLASCANSWAEAADFQAPAMCTLRIALLLTAMVSCWSGWQAVQALTQVNRYWGIITVGWVPIAALGLASAGALMSIFLWCMVDTKSKPGLLAGQLFMQVLCIGCALLAMLCWAHPSQVDPNLSSTLCKGTGPRVSDSSSRLCHYLPVVQEQISLAIGTLMFWNALLAMLTLAVACAGSWHFWELGYVEKKAIKHKRRRKQRKRSVPWDKIKVEDIGPVSYYGGAAPTRNKNAAAAVAAAGVAAQAKKSA